MQGNKLYLKTFLWICLVLTKTPRATSFFSNSDFPEVKRSPDVFDMMSEKGIPTMIREETYGLFCFVKELTPTDIVKGVRVGADIYLIRPALYSLNFGVLSYWKMATFAATFPASILPEKYRSSAVSVIESYWCKACSFLNLRKEEKTELPPSPPPPPPPEDSPIDKLSKRFFRGFDGKHSLVKLKEIVKNVVEGYIGITLSLFCYLCILAFLTSMFVRFVVFRQEFKNSEEMEFTDEELLEQYDDMPEFCQTLETWLTTRRQNKLDDEKTRREENHDQFWDYNDYIQGY